jgi:hypothetical protein
MRCQSSRCLRCAKISVDTWVSQVSQALHAGVISRPIILTVPAMVRTTFYQHAAVVLRVFMRCGAPCLDLSLEIEQSLNTSRAPRSSI